MMGVMWSYLLCCYMSALVRAWWNSRGPSHGKGPEKLSFGVRNKTALYPQWVGSHSCLIMTWHTGSSRPDSLGDTFVWWPQSKGDVPMAGEWACCHLLCPWPLSSLFCAHKELASQPGLKRHLLCPPQCEVILLLELSLTAALWVKVIIAVNPRNWIILGRPVRQKRTLLFILLFSVSQGHGPCSLEASRIIMAHLLKISLCDRWKLLHPFPLDLLVALITKD